jgi:hypothetical protein
MSQSNKPTNQPTNQQRQTNKQATNEPNVTLTNENTSVMDRLGQTQFEHLSLKTTLEELLDGQRKHITSNINIVRNDVHTQNCDSRTKKCVEKTQNDKKKRFQQQRSNDNEATSRSETV